MQVSLLYATPSVETLIERCARVCYRSESKTTPTSAIPLIRGLLASGHESVIEHSRFVFAIYATDKEILEIVLASQHIKATRAKGMFWLLSGNARAWRDALSALPDPMVDQLQGASRILFVEDFGFDHYVEPHTTIDQTANVELWGLHIPDGLSREEMLAHGAATVYLHGVSRALTHQLVRHRMASYSMASQRYCKEDGFEVVTPESMILPVSGEVALRHAAFQIPLDEARKAYKFLVDFGFPKEDARYILPNAACTEIAVTMTLEGWQHFFELRCDRHAQWEIMGIAEQIKSLLVKHVPEVFA